MPCMSKARSEIAKNIQMHAAIFHILSCIVCYGLAGLHTELLARDCFYHFRLLSFTRKNDSLPLHTRVGVESDRPNTPAIKRKDGNASYCALTCVPILCCVFSCCC